MQLLTVFETTLVTAGTLHTNHAEPPPVTQTYIKTRSAIGALAGALIGAHVSPASLIAYAFAGLSVGWAMGMFETWLWLD